MLKIQTQIEETDPSVASACLLADRLALGSDEIICQFRQSLDGVSSPLISTTELWGEAREHARLVIQECAEALRESERPSAANAALGLSVGLSTRGPLQSVHPADTLRSSGLLFQICLQYLVTAAAGLPPEQSSACLGRAVAALNHSLATCLQVSAAGYDAYLLKKVEESATGHRQRLARDLHDRLGQSLALAYRCLDLHDQAMAEGYGPATRDRHLGRVRGALDEATGYARGLISDLRTRPGATGLAEALLEYAEAHQAPGVRVHIEVNGDESWVPAGHAEELFLVLREFLRNSLTHAAPSTVALEVDVAPHRVDCFAHDDGIGFDQAAPPARDGRSGTGLLSMRERVQALGGTLHLTSAPGVGTGMRLSLLLPEPDPATAPDGRG
ncbi:ATP-binding protein [Streptomyces sp. NPDC006638]|uniref:sensor histidine kinase n=1 Tax=Streptomyces sp. NPDC006638 TaxID=3157183 RepID=UPI0033B7643D